ncbi:MAG: Crp/Fnr family transcriptional regulator [Sphingomonadales bacterium]|nr:Crp/Fnr family transcriptional regulator [Sphingomonadales bacterium]MDE2568785.1 Crp/Fnr family transcriptional regulator [Sphingomonadales bacterium]
MQKDLHSGRGSTVSRPLRSPTLFGELPPEVQARLRAEAPRRRFADGELVQQRGDAVGGFWLIERGQVRLGQFSHEGTFSAVSQLGPGDSFGELALLAARPRIVDGYAVGTTELLWIRAPAYEAALAGDPATMRSLLGALSAELQEFIDFAAMLQRGDARTRVAQFLANLARDRALPCCARMSQQDLAELVGTTRVTVGTVLARLEEEGAIRRGYREIEILDPNRLRALAR